MAKYLFDFTVYDLPEELKNEEKGYNRRARSVDVTVVADDVNEAEAKARQVVTRDQYDLDTVTELNSDGRPVTRY